METQKPLLDKQTLRSRLQSGNWSITNLAYRWELSPEYVSRLIADNHRKPWWNDAITGLPVLTRIEAKRLTAERLKAKPPKHRKAAVADEPLSKGSGYRYRIDFILRAVVSLSSDMNDLREGTRGVVLQIREANGREEYLIQFPGLTDWFGPDTIDRYIVATGEDYGH